MSLFVFLTVGSTFIRFQKISAKKLVKLVTIILGEEGHGHKNKFGIYAENSCRPEAKTAARISPNSGSYVSMFILQATSVLLADRKGTAP